MTLPFHQLFTSTMKKKKKKTSRSNWRSAAPSNWDTTQIPSAKKQVILNLKARGASEQESKQHWRSPHTTTLTLRTHTHTQEEANSLCQVFSDELLGCNITVIPPSSITSPPDWSTGGKEKKRSSHFSFSLWGSFKQQLLKLRDQQRSRHLEPLVETLLLNWSWWSRLREWVFGSKKRKKKTRTCKTQKNV